MRRCIPRARRRCGTTTVELAFVLPVFLTLVFSVMAYGHAQMIDNLLQSACRNAARQGATEGVTTANVVDLVKGYLGTAIDPNAVTVLVKDASAWDGGGDVPESAAEFEALTSIELSDTEVGRLFLVRATVNYNDVAILSLPFSNGLTLTGQSFMRHE